MWETVDACYAFSQDTNILDERFEIIFFHDVFRDDPLRDPNIPVVIFAVEGSDEIKCDKSMQMKRVPFVEMNMLRRSLAVVISAVGVYVSPW